MKAAILVGILISMVMATGVVKSVTPIAKKPAIEKTDTAKNTRTIVEKVIKADTTVTIKIDTIRTITYDTIRVTKTIKDTAIITKTEIDTIKAKK